MARSGWWISTSSTSRTSSARSSTPRPTSDGPRSRAPEAKLKALNPDLQVRRYEFPIRSDNALEIFADYDVVVDGTDNVPTRYLVNDACVLLGKPNVYGSIFRFDGQASVFFPPHGPCYRCLYPEPPPPDLVPNCAEGGVLGILPGVIGVIQATETVKLILGAGRTLIGRLLLYDALDMAFREMKVRKNPKCPICGPQPTITGLIDYQEFCGVRGVEETANASAESGDAITPRELKAKLDRGDRPFILDVRNPEEIAICRIAGSTVIPLPELPARLGELDPSVPMVVHCKSGARSAKAIALLQGAGFSHLSNLTGGIPRPGSRTSTREPAESLLKTDLTTENTEITERDRERSHGTVHRSIGFPDSPLRVHLSVISVFSVVRSIFVPPSSSWA